MTCCEIKSFEEVILFELQKLLQANADRRLLFGRIWQSCAAAALNLPGAPPSDLKRKFAYKIFQALGNLEGRNLVVKHTRGSDPDVRITHVTATARGVDYLKTTVFTHPASTGGER